MRGRLERQVRSELQALFGHTVAYSVLAVAFANLDRFAEAKQRLPACARSLASYALATSAFPEEDEKRKVYLTSLTDKKVMTVMCMTRGEALWAMCSPLSSKGF